MIIRLATDKEDIKINKYEYLRPEEIVVQITSDNSILLICGRSVNIPYNEIAGIVFEKTEHGYISMGYNEYQLHHAKSVADTLNKYFN